MGHDPSTGERRAGNRGEPGAACAWVMKIVLTVGTAIKNAINAGNTVNVTLGVTATVKTMVVERS